MQSPLALVLDDDPTVRERARAALTRSGIEALAVATPHEAVEMLRIHPSAVVVAVVGEAEARVRPSVLEALFRLRQQESAEAGLRRIPGRSDASQALRQRVSELAGASGPVLFAGEGGSGRRYAARCVHALSKGAEPFAVADPADPARFDAALAAERGTVFIASLERLSWPMQEGLAESLATNMVRPRLMASIGMDPRAAADQGRLSPGLLAAFGGSIVRVPPLRERRSDIALLVRLIVEDLRRLNGLAPITVAADALSLLERHAWPGNVDQLRNAVESAVIVASDGTIRAKDLPDFMSSSAADGPAALRFRDAKRSVVEAFERTYLHDLLTRHAGNVTGAAETSGMLRSALQRLLRKHALHSADFRFRTPGPTGT